MPQIKKVVMKIEFLDMVIWTLGLLYFFGFSILFFCGYSSFQLYFFHLLFSFALFLSAFMDRIIQIFLFIIAILFLLLYWKFKNILILKFFFDTIRLNMIIIKGNLLISCIFLAYIISFIVGIILFDQKYIILSEFLLLFFSLLLGYLMWNEFTFNYLSKSNLNRTENLLVYFQCVLIPFIIGASSNALLSFFRWNLQKISEKINHRIQTPRKMRWSN
jgi:hypothetical protein